MPCGSPFTHKTPHTGVLAHPGKLVTVFISELHRAARAQPYLTQPRGGARLSVPPWNLTRCESLARAAVLCGILVLAIPVTARLPPPITHPPPSRSWQCQPPGCQWIVVRLPNPFRVESVHGGPFLLSTCTIIVAALRVF